MQLVSLIITCFNSQETIERAVKSAISQSWSKKEIIVVDDCSTDRSYEILKKISNKEKDLILLRHEKNLGYPAALNTAIRKSKGEFVAIFDDDDINIINRISLQVNKIINYEKRYKDSLILCYSNRDVFKYGSNKVDDVAYAIGRKSPEPSGIEVAEFLLGFPVNRSKVWGMFGSCTLMVRRKLFTEIGLFDENFRRTAEWDFAIRAAFYGAHFIAVNKSLIQMHKSPGSDKAGLIPLIYSLKLREKYKTFLQSRGFYRASKLIAKSNFYMNKKKRILGITFRFLALLISPKLLINFLINKFSRLSWLISKK